MDRPKEPENVFLIDGVGRELTREEADRIQNVLLFAHLFFLFSMFVCAVSAAIICIIRGVL